MATITFSGATDEQIEKMVKAKMAKRLEACAILMQNEMRIHLAETDNIKGSPAMSAASAGGYPTKIVGRLLASVRRMPVDVENLTAIVGSNVLYSKWLQRGTRKMAARPWITLSWNACREKIVKIIEGTK
jgi:phage gpG-like protein